MIEQRPTPSPWPPGPPSGVSGNPRQADGATNRLIRRFFVSVSVIILAGLAAGTWASAEEPAQIASVTPALSGEGQSCTTDGVHCIAVVTYIPDVCRTIEALARENDLDPDFFVRLLWQESLFDAAAVSPAGAEGIAQFMPGTAELRGLQDPFNPAEALSASAAYLSELVRDYGNVGLAAAAYNAGEKRLERFVAGEVGLPLETRDYVYAITGHSAGTWRDRATKGFGLASKADEEFQKACIARAEDRNLPVIRQPLLPWGVIIASARSPELAERQVARLQNRHAPLLRDETVAYVHGWVPGVRRLLHNAQIGRQSRAEADALCERLRGAGAACMVLRN